MFNDSPLIQELLAEKTAETTHNNILAILTARFGAVPPDLAARLRAVRNEATLKDLITWAALCADLDAFRARLS